MRDRLPRQRPSPPPNPQNIRITNGEIMSSEIIERIAGSPIERGSASKASPTDRGASFRDAPGGRSANPPPLRPANRAPDRRRRARLRQAPRAKFQSAAVNLRIGLVGAELAREKNVRRKIARLPSCSRIMRRRPSKFEIDGEIETGPQEFENFDDFRIELPHSGFGKMRVGRFEKGVAIQFARARARPGR